MKKNVNVFIGVVLCAVLCGTFVWLQSAGDEDTWKPAEIYDQIHTSASATGASYTTAISSGVPVSGGVALSMSSRSSMRRTPAFSYAGASYAPAASSPLASSPAGGGYGAGLYTTSSAQLKSFGGGGNGGAAMGGAMSNRQSNSGLSTPSLQGGAGVGISPIAYSSARRSDITIGAGDNPAQMVAENPVMAMTNAASAGVGNGLYGGYTAMDYSGSANYGQYTGMFGGGRSNVRGRQNAQGFNDTWWKWFDTWVQENGRGYYNEDGDGYYFNRYSLESVYNDFLANFWNSGMGDPPTFDDWLDWYQSAMGTGYYVYGDNHYYWVPVGDILPLLLIAFLYVLFVAIKSNALKSLIKTERSE